MREDVDPGSFGSILRQYRSAAGLTQEELARQSGLSVRAVSDMERGRTTRPYARTLRLLADALDLDEPARGRLMGAVDPVCTESGVTEAGADAEPRSRRRRDGRSWLDPRRAGRSRLAAAGAAVALAGGLLGWAVVSHGAANGASRSGGQPDGPQSPLANGAYPTVAHCDHWALGLTSSPVRASNGAFWGTVEVRYSYRCGAVWTRFDPSPAIPADGAVTVTLEIALRPGGEDQVSRMPGTTHRQRSNLLLLHGGCALASVTLTERGRGVASATTACKAAP